jgi:hypothetical protein
MRAASGAWDHQSRPKVVKKILFTGGLTRRPFVVADAAANSPGSGQGCVAPDAIDAIVSRRITLRMPRIRWWPSRRVALRVGAGGAHCGMRVWIRESVCAARRGSSRSGARSGRMGP